MAKEMYPQRTMEIEKFSKELAPAQHDAFMNFSKAVFAEGALTEREKQLIAVAVAHTTQCAYCLKGHTQMAQQKGATAEQIMEAIWVAAEMRAGGAVAHSHLALDAYQNAPGGE